MRETDIINICKNFYDSNEIENSKGLIFQIYGKEEEIINRKGTNKITSDIQDIIKLVRSNLPPENIKLCITACTRLPPVTLDHIDDVTLVKQVVDLRLEIFKCSTLSEQIDNLKSDFND